MKKLLRVTQSLSCTIVDFDFERITVSLSGGIGKSSTRFQDLKKKSNNGKEDLTELFRAIYDDAFLKKNIIGIEIISDGSLKMYNRNFDYQIDFGKLNDLDRKFKNYKAFFQKVVLDSSIAEYKKIDLRFAEQVVCTK